MHSNVKELIEISQTMLQGMKKFAPNQTNIGSKFCISVVQQMTLKFVIHHDCCKTSDIADFLSVSRSDVTRITDILVSKGFIERINDEKDRRVIRLKVNDEGKKKLLKHNV